MLLVIILSCVLGFLVLLLVAKEILSTLDGDVGLKMCKLGIHRNEVEPGPGKRPEGCYAKGTVMQCEKCKCAKIVVGYTAHIPGLSEVWEDYDA